MGRLIRLTEAWRSLRRRTRWVLAGCALAGIVSFGTQLAEIPARSALRGSDNTFNYFWLRSLMVDGDWDFKNDIEACDTLTPEYREGARRLPPTPAGRTPNKYGVGWALVSAPFYVAADGVVAAGNALGVWSLARDGYNPVYQIALQCGHALLALAALGLAYRFVRRTCEREPALLGVALAWAASPLLYYQTSNLSMSHGVAFFAVTVCAWASVRALEEPARAGLWVLAGAGLGLAVITRFQAAVYGLVPLWAWVMCVKETRSPKAAVMTALGLVAGAAPLIAVQLRAWKVVYGSWLVFSYGEGGEGFNWTNPQLANALFSANHGLFYWHPLLLVGTAGLIGAAWRERGWAVAAGAAVAVMIYVNAAWWCWWFGAAFGGRAFDGAMLFFMAGFAWVLSRCSVRVARIFFTAGVACAGWNVVLLTLYRLAAIPRNGPVSHEEMVRALVALITKSPP